VSISGGNSVLLRSLHFRYGLMACLMLVAFEGVHAQTIPVNLGETKSGSVSQGSQRLYSFSVTTGGYYLAELTPPPSQDLDLYGHYNNTVNQSSGTSNNGFSCHNGAGLVERIGFQSNYSGQYFLSVYGYGSGSGNYSLTVRQTQNPTVTQTFPNLSVSGLEWAVDSSQTITWTTNEWFDEFHVQITRNGQLPYQDLATITGGYGGSWQYTWTVTAPTTDQCRIRVQGRKKMYAAASHGGEAERVVWFNPANENNSAQNIKIVPAQTNNYITIDGPTAVTENSSAQFQGTLHYKGGGTAGVTSQIVWSIDSGPGTISYSSGNFSASSVVQDSYCVIRARYTGLTDATKQVLVQDVPAELNSVQVEGDTTPDENASTQYACRAFFADSSNKTVTGGVSWRLNVSSAYATISSGGLLTAGDVAGDTPCTITATYGGKTGTLNTTIKDSVPAPPPAPSLVSPAQNAVTTGTQVTFQWSPVPGTTNYYFRLDKSNGGWYVNEATLPGSQNSITIGLPKGLYDSYVWKVKAANAPGNWGPWSVTRTVRYTTPQNAAVVQQNQAFSQEPINTYSGAYTYSHQDLKIAGRGMGFEFARFYNSKAVASPTQMAPKWRHTYQVALEENSGDGSVIIHWANCTEDFFTPAGGGQYTGTYGGFSGTLTKAGDGSFLFVTKGLLRYLFAPSGTLLRIEDRNGNTLVLNYVSGRLESVTDTVGRSIHFGYDGNNRLTSVSDFGTPARTLGFAYEANGDLKSAADVLDRNTLYIYDPAYADGHCLKTIVDRRGNTIVDNVYDAEGRVTRQTNANGKTWDYTYTPEGVTTELDAQSPTRGETRYTYDANSWLVKKEVLVSPGAYLTETYEYNDLGFRSRVVNPRGYYTRYTYDGHGNAITITRQYAAGDVVTAFEYNLADQVTLIHDALGRDTRFDYDAKGNLVKVRKPLGHETQLAYDPLGQLLSETDALGQTTAYAYDAAGNRNTVIDALGNITRFEYDPFGRVTKVIEPGPAGSEPFSSFAYYADDAVRDVTDQEGHTTHYGYDENGNPTLVRNPKNVKTQFAFSKTNLLETVTEAATGRTTVTGYDLVDRVLSVKDRWNKTASNQYDLAGHRTKTIAQDTAETIFGYDPNGNLTSVTNANGHITTMTYDDLDRRMKTVDALGNTVENTYDAAGRLVKVKDANGKETAYAYDDLDRLTEIKDPLNGTLSFVYDLNGNRLSITDPNGHVTHFEYDACNHVTAESDAVGKGYRYTYDANGNLLTRLDTRNNTTTYAYYKDHRLKRVTYPNSTTVAFTYDANGNRLTMADANGTTAWVYDDLDRITGVTDSFGNTVGYAYDQSDDLRKRIVYPGAKNVDYSFDANGRLASLTDWAGHTFTYGYYPDGSVKELAYPNGCKETRTYYANERLQKLVHEKPGGEQIVAYTYYYDGNGNITGMDRKDAVPREFQAELTNYSYNNANEIKTAGPSTFTFDGSGNQAKVSGAAGTTNYIYDYENRLTTLDPPGADAFHFLYNGLGDRIQSTENGTPKRYLLDTNKGLTDVLADLDVSNAPQQYYLYGLGLVGRVTPSGDLYNYHPDHIGSVIAVTDQASSVTGAFAYDEFGAVAGQTGSEAGPWRFCGAIGIQDNDGILFARARYWSSAQGRFLHRDPILSTQSTQVMNLYVYATNGPLRFTDPSGRTIAEGSAGPNVTLGMPSSRKIDAATYAKLSEQLWRDRNAAIQAQDRVIAICDEGIKAISSQAEASMGLASSLVKGDVLWAAFTFGKTTATNISRIMGNDQLADALDNKVGNFIEDSVGAVKDVETILDSSKMWKAEVVGDGLIRQGNTGGSFIVNSYTEKLLEGVADSAVGSSKIVNEYLGAR